MSDTLTDLGKIAGTVVAVVAAIWAVAKDKIAADLAPKLGLYFRTRDAADHAQQEHQKDHRLLESQIATVAEHKALKAVEPLTARVEVIEGRFDELDRKVETSRAENREDFTRLFERIEQLSLDLALAKITPPKKGA